MAYDASTKRAIGAVRATLAGLGITRQSAEFRAHGHHEPAADAPLLLVACSGGRDSMALASVAHTVAGMLGVRCGAVIIDHGMQAGSTRVALDTAARCRALGLNPVIARPVAIPGAPGTDLDAYRAAGIDVADAPAADGADGADDARSVHDASGSGDAQTVPAAQLTRDARGTAAQEPAREASREAVPVQSAQAHDAQTSPVTQAAHDARGTAAHEAQGAAAHHAAPTAGHAGHDDSMRANRARKPRGEGAEAAARDARYREIGRVARDEGAAAVLLAHTLDDQAETMMIGLIRGSGPGAAAGMPATIRRGGVTYARPLLGLTRADTTAICRAAGIAWWDDPTNGDAYAGGEIPADLPLRSQLRHAVMPALARIGGAATIAHMAKAAAAIRDDNAYLDAEAARIAREQRIVIPVATPDAAPADPAQDAASAAQAAAAPAPAPDERIAPPAPDAQAGPCASFVGIAGTNAGASAQQAPSSPQSSAQAGIRPSQSSEGTGCENGADDRAGHVPRNRENRVTVRIDADALAAQPRPIRTRIIARTLADLGVDGVTARHIERIEALAVDWHGQGSVRLPQGFSAFPKNHVIEVCQDNIHANR